MVLKLEYPYPAEPTVYQDGLARMLRIWEKSRDLNTSGWGSGVLFSVWGHSTNTFTSCSPFTGTTIGMMFDHGSGEDQATKYKPKYHGKQQLDLPSAFYQLHNGAYFNEHDIDKRTGKSVGAERLETWKKNGWPTPQRGEDTEAAQTRISMEFFNLGYKIDPRDMRRGDLVAIQWNDGGGHATFCWDVHYGPTGAVDAFLIVSANGGYKKDKKTGKTGTFGVGVSVGVVSPANSLFVGGDQGSYKKNGDFADKLFKDHDKYTQYGWWYCRPRSPLTGDPGVLRDEIDLKTFKPPLTWGIKSITDARKSTGIGPASVDVYRFWGFAPPESPHDNGKILSHETRERAQDLAKNNAIQPDSKATGTGKPPQGRIENVSTTPVPKSHPDPVSVPAPKPAKQPKAEALPHQNFVEIALHDLHDAGWIDKSPGDAETVHDSQTREAVRDFQTKFKAEPIDGIAGPITKAALKRVVADLHAGKPNPNGPEPKPDVVRQYWLHNRVEPGGTAKLAIEGEHLDLMQELELLLRDTASGKTVKVSLPRVGGPYRGTVDVTIPEAFVVGAALVAQLTATSSGGKHEKASNVPLHVGTLGKTSGDWPWADAQWSQQMRDIAADLRATPAPSGPFQRFEITQFGVKEKIDPGDIEVCSPKGQVFGTCSLRSLMLADIEGTMRLDGRILNIARSGNVYEPKEVIVDGKKVTKNKPNPAKFDPKKSQWVDVSAVKPWGAGARMPLIPYRVLAINPKLNGSLYHKKVYIKQLDGMTMSGTNEKHNGICIVGDAGGMRQTHFDLFVGREDHHIGIPSVGTGDATICEIQVLGDCASSHPRNK